MDLAYAALITQGTVEMTRVGEVPRRLRDSG